MIERISARRGSYRDSVTLMLASSEAAAIEGVAEASAVAATPLNLDLLARVGFEPADLGPLEPSDLVVAVRAESEQAVDAALAAIEARLSAGAEQPGTSVRPPRSLAGAARRNPGANLAVISVPGTSAAYECASAIEAGLHVFCFSSGFDASLELALKRRAVERGLLMMGPDCGTAIVDGIGIGFANQLSRGPVGIVGASGTGIQQVGCLLDGAGVGISNAIGVGGRDLGAEVGGVMTMAALELLEADPGTEVIVVIAKGPDPVVAAEIAGRAGAGAKPVVLCFPGAAGLEAAPGVELVGTLEQAARAAAELVGRPLDLVDPQVPSVPAGSIRGLFSGGTLRDEAMTVIAAGLDVRGAEPPLALSDEHRDDDAPRGHLLIDYGSEQLTLGRAHPMIDPSLRNAAVTRAGAEPGVSVLLVDVVLGRSAHPDPAGELAPRIESALAAHEGGPAVIVSLCGASGDPQGLDLQAASLRAAGATVSLSNAGAARVALLAASGREPATERPL